MNNTFNIDLNITRRCNYRCRYCFEDFKNSDLSYSDYNILLKNIKYLIDKYSSQKVIFINFWGGEPTLNFDMVKKIIIDLSSYSVNFIFYTNGGTDFTESKIHFLVNNNILIRISYDGWKIHSLFRFNPRDLKDKINYLKNEIKYNKIILNPCLPILGFNYLYETYVEFNKLGFKYIPNLAFYNFDKLTNDNLIDLKTNLMKIIKYENVNNISNFQWPKKGRCDLSLSRISIDTNLDVYPCHGSFYDSCLKITNLNDENWELKYNDFNSKLKQYNQIRCISCDNLICYNCNIHNYNFSKKSDDMERLHDFSCDKNLCKISTIFSNIYRAKLFIENNKDK